jgi:hypothetical protein
MYPQRELERLAHYKIWLRRNIGRRRGECAVAIARLAQPVAWFDRILAFWRRLSPLTQFAAVPVGVIVQRTLFPRMKFLGSILRWGPLALGLLRGLGAARKR